MRQARFRACSPGRARKSRKSSDGCGQRAGEIRVARRGHATSFMSAVFVDTNLLLYADDVRAPAKRERAQSLLDEIAAEENGHVSIQVLQEHFAAAARKLGPHAEDA